MPGYKIHVSGGMLAALVVVIAARAAGIISPQQLPELLGAALCGALFPDIDTHSMGRRIMYLLAGVGALVATLCGYPAVGALWVVCIYALSLLPHRGPTHRSEFLILLSGVLLATIAIFFPTLRARGMWALLFFSVGVVSHLVLDGRLIRRRKRRR